MLRALALVPLMGCTLYFGEEVDGDGDPPDGGGASGTISFVRVRSIAGELPIAGIESDREGGLWIAYQLARGGYETNDETRVVHLDASGTKLKEFVYTDSNIDVSGIAFSGDAVWLNYGDWDHSSGDLHVRKLDPETGELIGTFPQDNGVIDLDVHDNELRLSHKYNEISAVDLLTGAERWRVPVTAFRDGGTQRGLASLGDGRMWVASWTGNQIYLLGPDGELLGSGRSEYLEHGHAIDVGLHLAWDGMYLLMVVDGQIHWLEPKL